MNVGVEDPCDETDERRAEGVFWSYLDEELKRPSLKGGLAWATNYGLPPPYVVLLRLEVDVGVRGSFQGLQLLCCGRVMGAER